jgi:uncharacterized protein YciI
MTRIAALATCVLLCAAGGAGAQDWPPPGLSCPAHLVVLFEDGPAAGKAKRLFAAHIAFVTAHLKSGDILSMGPFDGGGGLAVFRASDWEAARHILAEEPFTKNGVLKVSGHFTWTGCALERAGG